jgi:6,7-dimethyl-8-ribityllumazine synthase
MIAKPHILVIEGRFYDEISNELRRGAETMLRDRGASWEVASVSGALEVPQVLAGAIHAGRFAKGAAPRPFDGCVALGCVIRGETSHYDIVIRESANALMTLAITHNVPVANGILTVDTDEQAFARASIKGKNWGGAAVAACLELIRAREKFETQGSSSAAALDL